MTFFKNKKYRKYKKKRNGYWKRIGFNALGLMGVNKKATKALRLASKVKGMVNAEIKYHYANTVLNPTNTTLGVAGICAVAQGDGNTNRDGEKVRIKSIELNIEVDKHASATTSRVKVCLILGRDIQGLSAPVVSDIWENVGGSSGYVQNPRNTHQVKRYKIMKEWMLLFQGNEDIKDIKYYKKCSIPIKWTSSTATSYQENVLYVIAISDQATNTPTVNITSKIRFIDN